MAKNTIYDLDATFGNNTDVAGQSTAGSANANTIDTIFQKLLALLAVFGDELGGIGTVAGTADAITLTSSATYPIQSLAAGIVLAFKAGAANTGAATINVDGLGAKAIRRQGDSALSANDIVANGVYLIRYDTAYNAAAGAWVLLNPTVSSSISAASTTELLTGTDASKYATADAIAALWEKGTDIASAGTISIGEGGYFHITGTTTITDIDFATAKNGRWAMLVFDGALTLTHNATTLILPGAANITTVAGDSCLVYQDASDNVKVTAYQRADGTPIVSAGGITLLTEQATTSGTADKDFTIPAGAKRVTVMFNSISTSTASTLLVQLGDSGGVETTGYVAVSSIGTTPTTSTSGFVAAKHGISTDVVSGAFVLTRMNGSHKWVGQGVLDMDGAAASGAGVKTLSGELTTVRITVSGDTWDSGSVNVMYE